MISFNGIDYIKFHYTRDTTKIISLVITSYNLVPHINAGLPREFSGLYTYKLQQCVGEADVTFFGEAAHIVTVVRNIVDKNVYTSIWSRNS